MANDAVLTNLNIVSDLQCANDAVFVDVNIVTDGHLGVLEAALLLDVARANDAFLPDDSEGAHGDTSEVTSEHSSSLHDGLSLDHDFL